MEVREGGGMCQETEEAEGEGLALDVGLALVVEEVAE